MGWILLTALLAFATAAVFRRVTLRDYQRGLLYRRGRLRRELGAGVHWIVRPFWSIEAMDVRSRVLAVSGQEVLSADNVPLKVSLAIRLRVAEATRAVHEAQSFEQALYLEAQLIVRDLVSAIPVEEVLQKRDQLSAQLRERLEAKAAPLGLTLETVGIKDVMFPGSLKQIFSQVVEARKSAQASLERARGETATLRNLANAARLLEGNPSLITLRTLQTASDGKHTLVLGLSQPPLIPLQNGHREAAPPPEEPPPAEPGESQ